MDHFLEYEKIQHVGETELDEQEWMGGGWFSRDKPVVRDESVVPDPTVQLENFAWDNEYELREKANIHKARLAKHGKSKMNNKIYYQDKNGRVFNISTNGEKTYV